MESVHNILASARAAPYGNLLPAGDEMFLSVAKAVQNHMKNYDASHDFFHILRVLALSQNILSAEYNARSLTNGVQTSYDPTVVLLSALLHDVNDKKYAPPAIEGQQQTSKVTLVLQQAGASAALIDQVEEVVNHVSYSTEVKDPEKVRLAVQQHSELAIVQDADRIDAIGAIGIGRTFTFTGAKLAGASMQNSREHIDEKLEKLEGMMKTGTGRQMARDRTERLTIFKKWWDEETRMVGV
ncbi:hypothetical protein CBS115989_1543 [Aspergillus niger]|uniref:Contig An09c0170, genomic contig n=3 Tax=Aspergillus niger TaxID=5061 RepID=A2QUH9_ASPNC|nr:uncharacterized protein An09g05700 [Aspergillus niger]RDH15783.1 hypothetical protein M747DRAFT_299202 [Aspergillus niger ATCC 13496]KAI2823165.1 hypothetical protein CBS115989_1543 [Aspergillus niger]KAI2846237.1 hypothetical protein CBS11350_3777 [Aspergillus niger]KAI2847175.1 hypothetical protein CBS11232_7209 [Aspergillus niger]KAI2880411.1 hypothetical protein CBS115988_1500 [Aspergillus niger]|eukprot:XP_001393881.1 hypothetical protein ANI_1_1504084 [Aspergillus niger CBS 513.88]